MSETITYNTELEQLLKENSEECESLSILHRMSYEKYNKRSNYINIPVIILSSAIGFITGIDLQYDKMNIILGVGSVFVGIIKSVDTYFQLAKRAESHRICSLQFSQISKKLQIELTLHRRQRATAENMMNIVKTDIKNMQDIAPLIDDDIIELYNMKYRRYKRVKKPNFVNGLTEVKVNPYNNEREYEFASRQGSREASPNNENKNIQDFPLPLSSPSPSQNINQGRSQNSSQKLRENSSLDPMTQNQNQNQNQIQIQNQNHNPNPNVAVDIEDDISVDPIQVSDVDNLKMLAMYQQLQAKSLTQTPTPTQTQTQTPNIPVEPFLSQARSQAHSPVNSIRSESSIRLGEIRTDSQGNTNVVI
jgi:hypothetical protein